MWPAPWMSSMAIIIYFVSKLQKSCFSCRRQLVYIRRWKRSACFNLSFPFDEVIPRCGRSNLFYLTNTTPFYILNLSWFGSLSQLQEIGIVTNVLKFIIVDWSILLYCFLIRLSAINTVWLVQKSEKYSCKGPFAWFYCDFEKPSISR